MAVAIVTVPSHHGDATRGVPSGRPTISRMQAATLVSNARDLAVAEETHLTDSGYYSDRLPDLVSSGFTPLPGSDEDVMFAGARGQRDYCITGSVGGAAPWLLYDSQRGGVQETASCGRPGSG